MMFYRLADAKTRHSQDRAPTPRHLGHNMALGDHPAPAAIRSTQLEQLRSLVAELFPGNQFYSRKLNAAAVTFDIASLSDFSARFPFTTKAELAEDQRRQPPFGTNLTYPIDRYIRYHQTSGTGGAPLRWLDTAESWEWMLENWTRVLLAAGARSGDRVFFAFSFGPFIGFWMAFESAARLGCLCVPGGGLSSAARLQAIMDNGITMLCCTPTYGIRLGEVAAEEKIDLRNARVRTLIVAGEPGGSIPAVRARLADLWPGARVFDHHGMTETGPVTYQCPAQPGLLHVIETAYYAEIIDPGSGRPLLDRSTGSAISRVTGELVLTPLGRTGSPLLRYRTGDLVKVASQSDVEFRQPCACGSYELGLEGGILGRADDMVVIRGVNVYPSAVEEIVRSCGGIAEYQVEVSTRQTLPEISLQIEAATDCSDAAGLVHRLERRFETTLALRVPITLVPAGTLPRFDMKAKRWVRQ
jgi:phenylacetate-CoA ligase